MIKKICLVIFICFISFGCCKNKEIYRLEDKYYNKSEFIDMNVIKLNELVENKETFGAFIYQPMCAASADFEKVLKEFTDEYQISFYKLPYSELKTTKYGKKIKYTPSFIIFTEGKMADFLESDKDSDTKYYTSSKKFKNWFSEYIDVNNSNESNNSNNSSESAYVEKQSTITSNINDLTYDKNKVNIYLFWGDGRPHCAEELKFFEEIKKEYGNKFKLNTFEVWYNAENEKILKEFSQKMNEEIEGVPYTIIGNETFYGFNSGDKEDIKKSIDKQYKNSYDVYFNNK